MPGDLARIGRQHATVEEMEGVWENMRHASDRTEDLAEAVAIMAGLVEWLIVAMPGQKVGRDKAEKLTELDDARALVALGEDDG